MLSLALPSLNEAVVELVESPAFDDLLVDTVMRTFPLHEHERFVAHYRGLRAAWARDQAATDGSVLGPGVEYCGAVGR